MVVSGTNLVIFYDVYVDFGVGSNGICYDNYLNSSLCRYIFHERRKKIMILVRVVMT